jgi:hypothetical protein
MLGGFAREVLPALHRHIDIGWANLDRVGFGLQPRGAMTEP